jgi:3-O-methylgallate 3,4-dioxygenase
MADIVLGFASSHGPTMNTPPEQWRELGSKDINDVRYDYKSLRPKDGIEKELELDVMRARYAAVHKAIGELTDVMMDAKPDVIVVFSNPHGGVAPDRQQPTFAVHLNDPPPFTENVARGRERRPADPEPQPARIRDGVQYPTDGDLARHMMDGLVEEGIDVAANFQSRPGAGLDEAYNLLYHHFDKAASIPYVPVLVSRYLPNQATPKRCYELGQAVRRVIERWDSPKRVAVMGSGGLSHQIVDEDLDRSVIDALTEGDTDALFALDRQRLNRAPGTPEILNWVACAGVMEPKTMTLIDYVPCYRSMAGTGHGNTFGYWN